MYNKISVNQRIDQRKSASLAGQSVIEVIVAVAIFVIIAAATVVTILGSFSTTRLAKEETQATFFCDQGLEAVQSIRNQNWNNLVDGSYGLSNSGGFWSFSGSSDDPDGTNKFTRTIIIESIDSETKKITCHISWNFTPTRSNTVNMVLYLTNWQKGKSVGETGVVASCADYCQSNGYSTGTCRSSSPVCTANGETYESIGDTYCTSGASADTCCCAP